MELKLNVKDEVLAGVLDGAGCRRWVLELDWPEYEDASAGDTCWLALLDGRINEVWLMEDRRDELRKPLKRIVSREIL